MKTISVLKKLMTAAGIVLALSIFAGCDFFLGPNDAQEGTITILLAGVRSADVGSQNVRGGA
jgi:hypothetical protein